MFLAILLSSPGFALGMQEGDAEKNEQAVEQEGQNPPRQLGLPEDVVTCLYNLTKQSNAPGELFKDLGEMILGEIKRHSSFNLPLEMVLHMVDLLEFSSPLELLKFLVTLSSLNEDLRNTIKPHISNIVETKFQVKAELTTKFLKLVKGKRGASSTFLEGLLLDFEKQQKIKGLRKAAKADLKQAIKNLETAVYGHNREEAMDIIMSLPVEIFEENVGKLLKYLIDNNEEDILKMFIGAGVDINKPMLKFPFVKLEPTTVMSSLLQVLMGVSAHHDCYPITALGHASFHGNIKMVSLLISSGADVNVVNKDGYTALDLAKQKGESDIAVLLENHGAKPGNKT